MDQAGEHLEAVDHARAVAVQQVAVHRVDAPGLIAGSSGKRSHLSRTHGPRPRRGSRRMITSGAPATAASTL